MRKLLLTLLSLLLVQMAFAQYPYSINTMPNSCCGGDNNGMGNSFLTAITGTLDSIKLVIRTGHLSSGAFYVYNGNTTAGASQIYIQTATGIPTGAELTYMLKLSAPPLLNATSTYTFLLYDAPLRYSTSSTYANGTMWTGQGFLTAGEHTTMDVDFVVYIGDPATAGVLGAESSWMTYNDAAHTISLKNFIADEISVTDMNGRVIATGQGESLTINAFADGIYILSARKGNQVYTTRVYLKY